ncbi:MAG TPA: hypothetical protein VK205_12510 [Prolixibacteraceae bacterium]|nr:hypothetical protein [Prolixibacteraceae bacterium]
MKAINLLPILLFCLLVISCSKEDDVNTNLSLDKVSGYVQKGPYLNGTDIAIYELSTDFQPTGKSYSTEITDNKGTFEINSIDLESHYVEIKANGFYFNEVTKSNSSAQLSLQALSDLTDQSSLNVNILSTLERNRVKYLISTGKDFATAKKQAQAEILKIFEIEKPDITASEHMDITKTGDDNAILLAISVIVQGYLNVSEVSELLANISTDIKEDGVLDDAGLGTILINNAKLLKLPSVRENLTSRYADLGVDCTIPDFEKYVNQFMTNTHFVYTPSIEYPAMGKFGKNILDKNLLIYPLGTYSLKAVLKEGTSLKVKVACEIWVFPAFQDNTGWSYSDYDFSDNSRVFTATRTGEVDFQMSLQKPATITVYENGAVTPTWSKVTVQK